jgi:diadenosine tetraphosphatase ApaH/serine/threonine PP2A family protein phosphatase
MAQAFDLDRLLSTLEKGEPISETDVVSLLRKLLEVLYLEPNILTLQSPITIIGDIHGQLYDLFELFDNAGPKENQKFLFMGDYVDRGYYSLETVFYLAALKLKYPTNFFLLRGNHECRQVNQLYGFFSEAQWRYGHGGVWSLCNDVFDLLPMAALIDNRVFSVHGGLSPNAMLIETISLIPRNEELPAAGPLCDLCWSDPEIDVDEWQANQRGAGWLFGGPQVAEFCRLNGNLEFVTRSHQLVMSGYQWFFDEKLVTVWSAPNYMYRSGNTASILKYNGNESHEFVTFGPRAEEKRKRPVELPPQPYFI